MLRHIETTGKEPTTDHRDLMDCLNQLATGAPASPRVPRATASASATVSLAAAIENALASSTPASPPAEKTANTVAAPPPVTTTSAPSAPTASASEPRSQSIADTSIRVDVSQLDKLMNLVGELVLARNRLMPFAANHPNSAFVAATQGLNQITRSGGGEVIEYHSEILPLMRANEFVAGSGALPVPADGVFDGVFDGVVVAARGRRAGLVVGRIHDIVSEPLKILPWVGRRGLLGSAIVQEQVTALLDIPGILCEAQPEAVVKLS